jgi:Spy/CpxP family protein refolding chaperone
MRSLSTALLGTLLALSLSAITAPTGSYAKTPAPPAAGKPEPDELKRFEAAAGMLDLSAEQKSKVARLVQEVRASVKQIESSSSTPEQKRQKTQTLRTSAKEKLDHILTVAQDRELKKLLGGPKAGSTPHK